MNRFTEILQQLKLHKSEVDRLVKKYMDDERHDKETYKDGVYGYNHTMRVAKCKGELKSMIEHRQYMINHIAGEIQEQLKKWMVAPVDAKTLDMVCALRQCGVKVNESEIEALRGHMGHSYFGGKILDSLAEESGVMATDKRLGVEDYTKYLKGALDEADIFVRGYVGIKSRGFGGADNLEASEILPDGTPDFMLGMAAVCQPFEPNSSLLKAAIVWDGDGIPSGKQKKELSIDDRKIIDMMFDGCETTEQKAERARSLVEGNEDLREIISLSEMHREYLGQ